MRGVFVGGGVCRSVDLQDATGTQATFNFLCLVVFQGDDHLVPSGVERCHGGFAFRGAGETTQAAGHAGHTKAGPTPGDRAFAASEAEMHEKMAAASGQTVDQAYVAKMIAHHEGAVAMSEVALRDSRDPEIRRMAQIVERHYAELDYRLKVQAKSFWDALAQLQAVRQGVRDARAK